MSSERRLETLCRDASECTAPLAPDSRALTLAASSGSEGCPSDEAVVLRVLLPLRDLPGMLPCVAPPRQDRHAADAARCPQKPSPFGGVASPNPFAALSGSSSTATASNPFTFGSSTAAPASNGAAPSFAFGSTTTTFSASAPSSSTPAFGAPATSSFTFGAQTKPAAPAPAPAQSDKLKYYTSLRALNVSLLDAILSRIDKDPFIDLSSDGVFDKLKQKYEEHRTRVDKEHGMAKEDKMAVEAPSSSSAAAAPAPAPAPAFEIPEIFRNPPKPVPIADLTDTRGTDAAPASSSAPQKPTVADDGIPDIFKNPPKPVPIADLSEEAGENKIAPPAPPAVFAFAGSAVKSTPSSSSSSAPPAGGFVFKPDSAPNVEKSSFTFPAAASSSPSAPVASAPSASASTTKSSTRDELKPPSAPKLAPAKLTNPPSKPSPLRFGESVSPPTTPEKGAMAGGEAQKPKTGFSFGAQFGKIAKGEKEGEGEAKKDEGEKKDDPATVEEGKKEAPKPMFSFGSSTTGSPFSFGSATSTSTAPATTAFSFGSAAMPSSSTETPAKPAPSFGGPTPFSTPASTSIFSAKLASSPPIAASFGSSSPPSFGFGAALQPKDKDQPATFAAGRNTGFAFGSNIGSAGSTGFTFGSAAPPSNDKNQPVQTTTGFSFPSSTPASTSTDSTSAPAASANPFSFTTATAPPAADTSAAPSTAGETDSRAQTPGANPFTAPGEGEEGEDVLHSVRGKVWKIEGGQAKELGIANVSIKERQDNGKIRLLARNETNGAVLIVRCFVFCRGPLNG